MTMNPRRTGRADAVRTLIGLIGLVLGSVTASSFSLLFLAATSDAHFRCPGNQCDDAVNSAIFFFPIALCGLLLAVVSWRKLAHYEVRRGLLLCLAVVAFAAPWATFIFMRQL